MPKTVQLKTQATAVRAADFIAQLEDAKQRADAQTLAELMQRITGEPPVMWGPSIIGFGRYHYKYESGREGEICAAGFAPRQGKLVLYVLDESAEQAGLLARLGPHQTGKCCLYIKRLADVDMAVLEQLVRGSYEGAMAQRDEMHEAH